MGLKFSEDGPEFPVEFGAAKKPPEANAIKAGRFEEALGALSRRLSNRTEMLETVHSLLAVEEPNLENHKILLRLSRNLDNRPALVSLTPFT